MFAYLHIGSPEPRWRKLGVQGRHEGSQGSAVGSPDRSEPCQASRLGGGLGRPDSPAPRSATPPPLPATSQRAGSFPRTGRGGASPAPRRGEPRGAGRGAAARELRDAGRRGAAPVRRGRGSRRWGRGGRPPSWEAAGPLHRRLACPVLGNAPVRGSLRSIFFFF